MDCVKGGPWDREIVVFVWPPLCTWALDRCMDEIVAETGLCAAVDGKAPIFADQPWVPKGRISQKGLSEKTFGLAVGKIVCLGPQSKSVTLRSCWCPSTHFHLIVGGRRKSGHQ